MIPAPYKCVGGKSRLLPILSQHFPHRFTHYVEPFLGGGAVFRWLAARGNFDSPTATALLADACGPVIDTWRALQTQSHNVRDQLHELVTEYNRTTVDQQGDFYYYQRSLWNRGETSPARHIFLRQSAFNGLWRVNRQGEFNVPWGKYRTIKAPDLGPIAAALAQFGTRLHFQSASYLDLQLPHDLSDTFIYIDPPYWGTFDAYTPLGFDAAQHKLLVQACADWSRRGACVVYSNKNDALVIDLVKTHWPGAQVHPLTATQSMAAKVAARTLQRELVVCSGP